MQSLELIIIGAGPAGIAVAGEARRAGIAASAIAMIEQAPHHCASIRALYPPGKPVTVCYNGHAAHRDGLFHLHDCSKDALIAYLSGALHRAGVTPRYRERVCSLVPHPCDGTLALVTDRSSYRARAVVVAVGVLGRPRRPDYPLPASLRGRLHFDVTRTPITNADVLVVGGGDSAADYVDHLTELDNRVTLSYRGAALTRMQPARRAALIAAERRGAVDVWRRSSIRAVIDDRGRPAVRCDRGPVTSQRFEHIVYALGGTTPARLLRSLGVGHRRGVTTSVPGLYLAGDVIAGPGGASIAAAFDSSRRVVQRVCRERLGRSRRRRPRRA